MLTMTRGDTFLMAMTAKVRTLDPLTQVTAIVPADLTGWEIAAAITTDPDIQPVKKYPLTVEITDAAAGTYVVSGDSTDWPTGALYWRVKYTTDSEQTTTTQAVQIKLIEGI